ncbi:phage tail tape measure protein [Tropicibacter sp. R16_0]|uniref:phage tail tape measure protein n=1 Tax=Tropicibacter sp. R16_0 TaxID=2821102 RepID=UPI001ADB0B61|nr:phage tail tape measure protein [Tropicibacter sp. R16_0]MBO9451443.1 phage tail tape measure protein [Tropicibacter sp. R16_0]
MSKKSQSYVLRLSAEGRKQLERDLMALGVSGEKSLKSIQKAAKPASDGLKKTDKAARGVKDALRSVSQEVPAMQRLGRFLGTTALVGGLVAFGRTSLDVARIYQASMKRVQGVLRATEGQMALLDAKARELGATTAFTASQAADGIETLAKNGLSVQQILDGALDATLAMASALGAELAPSADLVTDLMLQFKLEAEELPRIADAVTGAALNSKFGFDDLRLAIGQAGGVAGKFGVELDEFLTSLAATSSAFASGSDAGTSYKNFLARLVPQGKQAKQAMDELGLQFFDNEGKMKSMAEVAEELRNGVAGLSEEARNSALQTIFGTDAIRTALALADIGGDGFRDLAEGLKDVSAQEQAEVRLQGLDGALKEVAAAWEALQLEAAQNGGLDVAEAKVDRLTDALRYLAENFPMVEEAASRVAQALVVVLVGRGIKLAVAQAVAMRAAYIELATQVTGVGTSASRAVGPLTRLGLAGRALTGVLGGPLSLAITAASLVALGLDADKASDAIGNSELAASDGAAAIEAYAEASRLAAEEQDKLGGKVSASTAELLRQGRAAVQVAIDKQKMSQAELLATAKGDGLLNPQHIQGATQEIAEMSMEAWRNALKGVRGPRPEYDDRTGQFSNLGPVFDRVVDALASIEKGDRSFEAIAADLKTVAGTGEEALSAIQLLDDATKGVADTDLQTARDHLAGLAEQIGGFEEQLAEIRDSSSEADLIVAYEKLRLAMKNAAAAGKLLRQGGEDGILALVDALARGEIRLQEFKDLLNGTWEASKEKPGKTFPEQVAEDADRAAVNLRKMIDAQREYAQSRMVGGMPDSSKPLLKQIADASDGANASAHMLRFFEGFRSVPYWDVNADRVGYGSDTITLESGEVRAVTKGTRVSVEDAERDLFRRIGDIHEVIIGKLGQDLFDSFTPAQQGAVSSLVYNYGAGDFSETGDLAGVLAALREGSNADVAAAIRGLSGHNQGVNAGRRHTEAQVFSGNVGVDELAARSQKERDAALEHRRRVTEAQVKALQDLLAAGKEQEAQLALEVSMMGLSAAEQARLTYVHQALTDAKRAGIDVDTHVLEDGRRLIEVINEQADAIARRTAEQERGKNTGDAGQRDLQDSSDAVRAAFDNFKQGGEGVRGFFDDIATHVADKLWELAFDPVWDYLGNLIADLIGNLGGSFGLNVAPAAATGGGFQKLAVGGGVQFGGRAHGLIGGSGHSRQDNILLWGSRDEFMQPASAVNYYGRDFMEAVRQRRLPRLADGGFLGGFGGGAGAASGPVGAAPTIVFEDHSSGISVKEKGESRGADGGRRWTYEFSDRVGEAIEHPGGGARRSLKNKYDLTDRGTLR